MKKKEEWKVELFNRVMGELMSSKIEKVKQMKSYPYSSSSSSSSSLLTLITNDDHNIDLHHPLINFHSNISQSYSSNPSNNNNNGNGRKRKRKEEKELLEKPKDVIHVRAKRGQATDSHSLAERVRREKINEKLRCLQDLVPGCYKTMGMAVMLDVIIHYVQSLQNQIEFLSMKLTAASMHYDFNLERDNLETMQQGTNAYELQEMERDEGYGGPPNYFHSADWAL